MDTSRRFVVFQSASAAARLDAAARVLRGFPSTHPVTVVGASRGAANDLVRRIAIERGATIGLARFSLTQLAARVAAPRLAGAGIAPGTGLGAEAVAARATFDAAREVTLSYFAGVALTPGFPRALARTLGELRAASASRERLDGAGPGGADLARLLDRVDRELVSASIADRARLFQAAAESVGEDSITHAPLLLLDVPIESVAEEHFLEALIGCARSTFATVPAHDDAARAALERAGGQISVDEDDASGDLGSLRRHLFAEAPPPLRALDGSLQVFSAPGEGREAVEIARRVLAEAAGGVRFDEMAILVRTPQHYQGLLEHALDRAGVPAWFDRGTRRPHPAGRAFLALLACASEELSARRFAEYLSLGQLPPAGADRVTWAPSADDVFGRIAAEPVDDDAAEEAALAPREGVAPPADVESEADLAGTLRAPRRWESLLVEASVIGGDPARWRRRLAGLAAELEARLAEVKRDDPESARAAGLERDLARLAHLAAFALPLVEEMGAWPAGARWGDWLDRLQQLAPRVLRLPTYVLRVLADLRPMAGVGPVSLEEVRGVLSDRLRMVDAEPPVRRYGRVFVGTPSQARGRVFRVVFVPGLAERMFPQKPRQDPLLLDGARAHVGAGLQTLVERGRHERLLLHLAVGAATDRVYLSYPRLDVVEARPRVPSFYALDLLRGATGQIPPHEWLADWAASAANASLAWPAPRDPDTAIDDQEHDLAVLRALLDAGDPASVRGHAQYLLHLNPVLRRAVTERWARAERKWSTYDGLIRVARGTRDALAAQRLGTRPYSLSALQKFSACPYQFLLSAIYRLEPAEQPAPIQRLDPLTRGTIVHRIQATFFRDLQARGALPVTRESLAASLAALDEAVQRASEAYRETLVPAIDRVWRDEIAGIHRDLRAWLRGVAADAGAWTPSYFELGFGLAPDDQRDPTSVRDPVRLEDRFVLRGSVDLVETQAGTGHLRVTDHKTGKNRTTPAMVIGGGAMLQPVLYSMVVERVTGRPVMESRLSFCTAAGGFAVVPIALSPDNRRLGIEALEIIDRAIEQGALFAAPGEGACGWCDFRAVCGPNEEARTQRKPTDRLRDLFELRIRP